MIRELPENLPKLVCLCGSTRFYDAFKKAYFDETMKGNIVLSVGFHPDCTDGQHDSTFGVTTQQKQMLDELHKRKIDLADEILVLNLRGYIGDSTKSEIAYAVSKNKLVRYLEPQE